MRGRSFISELNTARIGACRTLMHYLQHGLYKEIIEAVGGQFVLSPPTDRAILREGLKRTVDGMCLPIKAFIGHAAYLVQHIGVDYLLIPRLISLREATFICPQFMGLPDVIKDDIDKVQILSPIIDANRPNRYTFQSFAKELSQMGGFLHCSNKWVQRLTEPCRLSSEGLEASGMQSKQRSSKRTSPDLSIAVLGHPYLVADEFLSAGVLKHLSSMNVRVVLADELRDQEIYKHAARNSSRTFWSEGEIALGASRIFMSCDEIDGVIYVGAFACGCDSFISYEVESEMRSSGKPFMSVTVDEHASDIGFRTRLEAFCDLVEERRKQKRR